MNEAQLAKPASERKRQAPALLNERQSAELLGVSARKFHALRGEDWFPLAVELGPRALRWHRDELLQAIAQRAPRRTMQAEPSQLASKRAERAKAAA